MNSTRRDIITKGWVSLENETIVKDVATKGEHISWALSFLAKRLDASAERTKEYFNHEVDRYLIRLLKNKQILKAEHVLKNVGRDPCFMFYEFAQKSTDDPTTKDFIIDHLIKTSINFQQQMPALDVDLKILELCQNNPSTTLKYCDSLRNFSLEALNENGIAFRNMLVTDVYLSLKSSDLDVQHLNKTTTWTYFLENDLFGQIVKWLDIQYEIERGTYCCSNDDSISTFQVKLELLFAKWSIDRDMLDQLMKSDSVLSEPLKNSMARYSIFTIKEQKDVQRILQRIFTSESWSENEKFIESKNFLVSIARVVLSSNLTVLCGVEKLITKEALTEISSEFPNSKNEIQLCQELKSIEGRRPIKFEIASSKISSYLLEFQPNFYVDNPLVYAFDMITLDSDISTILEKSNERANVIAKIPFLDIFLKRLRNEAQQSNDHQLNFIDLIKQVKNIDLKQIRIDAGQEMPSFDNKHLIAKYSKPSKLDYIHYLTQYRSSYAVYQFLMEQLRDYAQITDRQIIIASAASCELAVNNFTDNELVTHCMAFAEMLGVNTVNIRAYIKCLNFVRAYYPDVVVANLTECDLIQLTQNAIIDEINQNKFNHRQIDALAIVYKMKGLDMSSDILIKLLDQQNWFQFLIFATYFQYPLHVVMDACERSADSSSPSNVGRNLARSIACDNVVTDVKCRRNNSLSYRDRRKQFKIDGTSRTSGETMSSSLSSNEIVNTSKLQPGKYLTAKNTDLFSIILQCTRDDVDQQDEFTYIKFIELIRNPSISQSTTALNLLRKAMELKWPLLTILAATLQSQLMKYCWMLWLMLSTNVTCKILDGIQDVCEMTKALIENCVHNGFIRTMHESMQIFYPQSNLIYLTDYLYRTTKSDFSPEVTELLQNYLIALNRDGITFECLDELSIPDMLNFSNNLLIVHLINGFQSPDYKIQLLHTLCESGINDFVHSLDFITIKRIIEIVRNTTISVPINLLQRDKYADSDIRFQYEQLCEQLICEKEFDKAMEIAHLLDMSKDHIIYESWIYGYENNDNFDLDKCEMDATIRYSLPPELLISFYISVTEKLNNANPKKYKILKKVLDTIKKNHLFPNETFNRDRIEYEMIVCFLKNKQAVGDIEIYHSEYFECIMCNERLVLYKSFMELKELAGIDDLTVGHKQSLDEQEIKKLQALINQLLDDGDIVEALRVQGIFDHRPLDLHYIVFCMALAEGLATLYDLTYEQRQMLSDGVKTAISCFHRRTLTNSTSTPTKQATGDGSDTSGNLEFEEIPSREKQDILEALQSLAAKVKHGSKIVQRIAMTWRASVYLDKEYVDVLKTKDPLILMQNAIDEDCLNKLVVMNDIMLSNEMTEHEIAVFLAQQIATSIIKSRFYIIQNQMNPMMSVSQNSLWGYDLDREFRMFLELCPNTTILGNNLLKYCDALKIYRKYDQNKDIPLDLSQENDVFVKELFVKLKEIMENRMLSHKKQNTITIELLIKAHDCFVHECYMEGIAIVLQRSKALNTILTNAKSWNLIVKMLMGIGRYRDMYYCFETLISNDQFESLLGQFDEDRVNGLKQAIILYLHEHCPENKEFFRLAALHFMMYKEIAEMWENEANSSIAKIIAQFELKPNELGSIERNIDQINLIQYIRCNTEMHTLLTNCMDGYAYAAENYLLDNKLALAQRAVSQAELVALQINLVNNKLRPNGDYRDMSTVDLSCKCISVINIRLASTMRHIVNTELNVPQSMILGRAYPFEINWTEAIFSQFLLNGNDSYLCQFCEHMELTECMIESIVKSFQHQNNITAAMEKNISILVEMVQSVGLRYKLASLLGLKKIVAKLINEQSSYYLKDTNYGRSETTF